MGAAGGGGSVSQSETRQGCAILEFRSVSYRQVGARAAAGTLWDGCVESRI